MASCGMQQNFDFDLNLDDGSDLLASERHCPLCGCEYEESHLVRESDGLLTLAVQCYCCGTGSLVTITHDVVSVPSATPVLTPIEQAFFASLRPISDDDIGRMRAIIQTHQGDLRDLMT